MFKSTTAPALAIVLLAAATALSGCNTVRGFGQDVEKVGSEIDEAATEEQND